MYSECVFVALGTQQAMRLLHIFHLWPFRLYNIFLPYLIKGEFKKVIGHKICVLIFYTTYV